MKTSNSEQMFIDTLRALGLSTDLCEAVNGMRKAVMEAEEAGNAENGNDNANIITAGDVIGSRVRSEGQLIKEYLYEPHKKLAKKLTELEEKRDGLEEKLDELKKELDDGDSDKVENVSYQIEGLEKDKENVENDINAIGGYYTKCVYFGPGEAPTPYSAIKKIKRLNDNGSYADYHWPIHSSSDDISNDIKFIYNIDRNASDDVKELIDGAFDAYNTILKELKKQHIVHVPVRGRSQNWTRRLAYSGSAPINLDNLIALVPRSGEREIIKAVIDKMDSGERLDKNELSKIYEIQERCIEELPILIKIATLENRLEEVSPEAYDMYSKTVSSCNTDSSSVSYGAFKELLDKLYEKEESNDAYNIVNDILDNLTSLYGGAKTKEYIQWRDILNTGAAKGNTVKRDPSIVLNNIKVKAFKSGLLKYKKMGGDDSDGDNKSNNGDAWKRESKNWTNVIRYGWKDRRLKEIGYTEGEEPITPEEAENNRKNDIERRMDFVIDITKDGTKTNSIAKGLKEYLLTGEIGKDIGEYSDALQNGDIKESDILNAIKDGIKSGDVKDDTIIDENISKTINIMNTIADADPLSVDKMINAYHAIRTNSAGGKDWDVAKKAMSSIESVIYIIENGPGTHTVAGEKFTPTDGKRNLLKKGTYDFAEAQRIISECIYDMEDIAAKWTGKTRLDDIANMVTKQPYTIPEELGNAAEPDAETIDKKKSIDKIDNIINNDGEDNGIIKKLETNGHVEYCMQDDEDMVVATRTKQSIGGVEYDVIEFKYGDKNYGTWMASNLNTNIGNVTSFGNGRNKIFAGNQNPVTGEGSGWLYTFDSAVKLCPAGWHIPTMAEWRALIGEYLGKIIENSSQYKGIIREKDGPLLIKSRSMYGLDCFDFGIFPGGSMSAVDNYGHQNANTTAYYWCRPQGERCIKFDYFDGTFNEDRTFVEIKKNFMACVRFVKD